MADEKLSKAVAMLCEKYEQLALCPNAPILLQAKSAL